MSLIVRSADVNDSPFITELCYQLGYDTTNEKMQKRLSEILKNNDNCVFVVEEDEKVIGWIHGFYSLRVESEFFVEIGGMVVDEHYRGKGIGKLLVEKVTEWSIKKNCNKIRVRSNIVRQETHKFYEKIGFSITKEQKIFTLELDR